jgi:hypothetical protein
MKICPVCNDSFADELNFCDIDGSRLAREGSGQERNKWWSFLGAGLLVGALVISAASMFFLPKTRVSPPVVSSEQQPVPAPSKASATETASNAAAASAEPESGAADAAVPDVKKKDRALANGNFAEAAPNPKAVFASEDADKGSPPADPDHSAAPAAKKPEAPLAPPKSVGDTRAEDSAARPVPTSSELKKDPKTQPTAARSSVKDSHDKKKNDEKDKKKGGFLRVFKKIFGKD